MYVSGRLKTINMDPMTLRSLISVLLDENADLLLDQLEKILSREDAKRLRWETLNCTYHFISRHADFQGITSDLLDQQNDVIRQFLAKAIQLQMEVVEKVMEMDMAMDALELVHRYIERQVQQESILNNMRLRHGGRWLLNIGPGRPYSSRYIRFKANGSEVTLYKCSMAPIPH
ncbi:unnamed protein product [Darwinula stevensoni]|uniref:Uncharacterized protein n=1 Tax=Darwinula stevensoni TaxID=69355 RepID=A0A7R9AC69_9CRUS|nr:unnamed protein product [Darwinula stevensoni]CAG0899863.1 unnamed protein product [Darwinula stevensoni]